MANDHSHHEHPVESQGGFWTSRAFLVFVGFTAIALVLLWEEHSAHILGVLPYMFLLACPLLHVFMHGRHGRHGSHGRHAPPAGDTTERKGGAP